MWEQEQPFETGWDGSSGWGPPITSPRSRDETATVHDEVRPVQDRLQVQVSLLENRARTGDVNITCQDLFSLAEAVGFDSLCASIDSHVAITDENLASWLDWLTEEHASDVRNITRLAQAAVKRAFAGPGFWVGLSPEQLVNLTKIAEERRTEEGGEGFNWGGV